MQDDKDVYSLFDLKNLWLFYFCITFNYDGSTSK